MREFCTDRVADVQSLNWKIPEWMWYQLQMLQENIRIVDETTDSKLLKFLKREDGASAAFDNLC